MSYERKRSSSTEAMFEAFRSLVEQNKMARYVVSPRVFEDLREIEIYKMINGEDYLDPEHPFFPILSKVLFDRFGEDLINDLREVFTPETRIPLLVAPMKKELPTSTEEKMRDENDDEDEEETTWEDELDDDDL